MTELERAQKQLKLMEDAVAIYKMENPEYTEENDIAYFREKVARLTAENNGRVL